MTTAPNSIAVGGRHPPLSAGAVRHIVADVLRSERRRATVSISFIGPGIMRRLNGRHKGHDWPTDVLSFYLPGPEGTLVGDIYICTAVALRQAARFGVSQREELTRLVVHGVLHLLGYDHPDDADREKSAMWKRQERHVARILRR